MIFEQFRLRLKLINFLVIYIDCAINLLHFFIKLLNIDNLMQNLLD